MTTKPSHFLSGKRIIVAGGSIAGSTFVAALDQLWDPSLKRPKITVLERKSREASIEQYPYMLSINGSTRDEGLIALQQLGLLNEIHVHATLNSGAIWVWSDTWKLLASINPDVSWILGVQSYLGAMLRNIELCRLELHARSCINYGRADLDTNTTPSPFQLIPEPHGDLPSATIRITRADLKRVLLKKAEMAERCTWQWSCTCEKAERLPNGQIRVTISNNTEAGSSTPSTLTQDCDLLIAADGADSRIRASFRPHDMKFEYAGATQIGGISHFPNGIPHPVHEDYGLQMSPGEGICCIYTPLDYHTLGWALSKMGLERAAQMSFTAHEFAALKKEALELGLAGRFAEPFKTVVEATDPTTAFVRPAKERPPFHHDALLRGVVFIGDANHVLNSFTLDGANLAFKDGWDLAEQICRNASMEQALKAYDKVAMARLEHVIKWSHERIRFGHSTRLMWKVYKYGMKAQKKMRKK